MSVDFPEPETPVMQVKTPMGIFRSTDCKLLPLAPLTAKAFPFPECLFFGIAIDLAPERNFPVIDFSLFLISSTEPSATI